MSASEMSASLLESLALLIIHDIYYKWAEQSQTMIATSRNEQPRSLTAAAKLKDQCKAPKHDSAPLRSGPKIQEIFKSQKKFKLFLFAPMYSFYVLWHIDALSGL